MNEFVRLKAVHQVPQNDPKEVLKSQLSFKGEFVRYYKVGKGLWLKTTKFLYKIHKTGNGFRLQQMRAYAH